MESGVLRVSPGPGQPKVADFEVAVCIQQQVARFQVSMENVGRVDVLQTPQYLMHKGFLALGKCQENRKSKEYLLSRTFYFTRL